MSQVVLYPGWQIFDLNGNPAAGAKASFFMAGTSTPVNVFSDSTLVTPHAVPVVADSEGYFPTIYAAAGDYKIKVTDSANVDLFPEVDNWTVLANLTQTILSFPTVTKTTNYTVLAADRGKVLEFDAAGSTLIVTLPAATLGAGFPIWIVNAGATGTIQLQFSGAETLLDLTTYSLTDKHQAVGLTSRGASGWRLIAAVTLERQATIASAATITLGDGGYFNITGVATITDIDFTNDIAGHKAWVKFDGVLLLTHNATTLILPTGVNISTQAGDTALFVSEGSDAVRCVSYNRASGDGLNVSGAPNVQQFTSAGTWTKPLKIPGSLVRVRVGGGGGSGGKGASGTPGGGGGGGGCTEKWFLLSDLGATEGVVIGVGGTAQTVASTAGNVGGNSTFGSGGTLVTGYGGGGGGPASGGTGAGGGGGGGGFSKVGTVGAYANSAGEPLGGGDGGDQIGITIRSAAGLSLAQAGIGQGGGGCRGNDGQNGNYGTTPSSGGGGGGSSDGGANTVGVGGNAVNGGAGGGAGSVDVAPGPGAGGTSLLGGTGGAGAFDASAATAGTQSTKGGGGGGGGGSETGTSGAGANGSVEVVVY